MCGIPQAGGFCINYPAMLAPSMKWLSTLTNQSFSQHPVTRDCIWGRFSEDMEWKTLQGCLTLRPQCKWHQMMPKPASSLQMKIITSKEQEEVAIVQQPHVSHFTRMIKASLQWPLKTTCQISGTVWFFSFF